MKIHSIQAYDGRVLATVSGKISRDQWPADQDILVQNLGPDPYGQKILLSLEQVDHIDSTGVEWLLKTHTHCQSEGGQLILHSISPIAADLLRIMRMDLALSMVPNEAEAIAKAEESSP